MKKIYSCLCAVIFLATAMNGPAVAKTTYPEKKINYIIAFPPGGKTDIQARRLFPLVEKYLGFPLVIQYVVGSGGRVGYDKIFKAKPDGYTLGCVSFPSAILIGYLAPTDYRIREFTPIFNCFVTRQVLVVAADTYKSVDELINAGKTKALTNGSSGAGSSSHLAAIIAANSLGLKDVRHVHFEGAGQAVLALAGKHIDFSVTSANVAISLVKSKHLKALLTIGEKRDPAFDNVPTSKEMGYSIAAVPAIDGLVGPPNLPIAHIKALESAFIKAAKDSEFLKWAEKAGTEVDVMDHIKFGRAIDDQIREAEKYRELMFVK